MGVTYTPPPTVVAGLIALVVLYALATGRYRDRFAGARPVERLRRAAFGAAIVVLALALASPLDGLADEYLFTAHMIQHLLLTLIAAPLLLLGTPDWLFREILDVTRLRGFAVRARHPLVAFFGFNAIFALAHVPPFYELTLANEPLHALEHVVFIATAMLMWLPVVSPAPGIVAPYPPLGQVLYLFLQTVPASLLGALLSISGSPLYPTYVVAPRAFAISALEDQQIGALIMWVGSGIFFLMASGIVFFAWAGREEAANRRPVGVVQ